MKHRRTSNYAVTLFALLPGTGLAWLPVGLVTAVPIADDPARAEVHVNLIDDPLTESSGWSHRVSWALSVWEAGAATLAEVVNDWSERANSVTWDLSVEVADQDASPDSLPFATWLDAQVLGVLGDHCALQAEVELISGMATVLA